MIEERIIELEKKCKIELLKLRFCSELSDYDKIPLRIIRAEILALQDFFEHGDLPTHIEICVDFEQHCGAEGIKNAKEWLSSKKLVV